MHCVLSIFESLASEKLANVRVEMVLFLLNYVKCYFQQEPVELMGMYGDSSVTSGMEAKSEHVKVLVKNFHYQKKKEMITKYLLHKLFI